MTRRQHLILETVLLFAVLFLPGYVIPAGQPDFGAFIFHLRYAVVAVPQILLVLFLIDADGRDGMGTELGEDGREQSSTLRQERTFRRFGIHRFRWSCLLPAVLAAATLIVLVMVLQYLFGHLVQAAALKPRKAYAGPSLAMLPLSLLTCILTGYREELFFRSWLLTRFEELEVPPGAAMAASTLLFAAGHLYEGIAGAVLVAVIGIFLALLFRRTRSIHVTALAHGLYNFGVLALPLALT